MYGESNTEAKIFLFIHDSFNALNLLYFKIFNLYSYSMRKAEKMTVFSLEDLMLTEVNNISLLRS